MTGVSRRRLLGTSALTAAGAAVAAVPATAARAAAAPRPKARAATTANVDVVIIGGGLSGLAAARDLVAAGKSVVLLEARARAGGRVYNMPLGDGTTSEGGAEFIGPTQDRIAALAKDMGVATFPTYNTGQNVYWRNGKRSLYATNGILGAVPPDWGVIDLEPALLMINSMAKEITPGEPWTHPKAEEWDSQTFYTWARSHTLSDGARVLFEEFISATLSVRSRDVSLLYVLNYVASAGNETNTGTVDRLINTKGGGQESRFVGGSALVPLTLAARLGKVVKYNAPARRIVTANGKVTVEADGITVTAKRAVVAMSPAMAAKIDFSPTLPAARAQLQQRYPMGSVAKFVAVYPTPFWRADGMTGQAVSDVGPIDATFDNSPPDGSRGIMMGFVNQTNIRKLDGASPADLVKACVGSFVDFFGDKAKNPVRTAFQRWDNESWSGGGPVGIAPPGVLSDFGHALREPCGLIHWAGTETASYWTGYMDGAVRSGERVAKEVAALI